MQAGALEEAVHYGRIELAKFFKLPGFDDLVRVLNRFSVKHFVLFAHKGFSFTHNSGGKKIVPLAPMFNDVFCLIVIKFIAKSEFISPCFDRIVLPCWLMNNHISAQLGIFSRCRIVRLWLML